MSELDARLARIEGLLEQVLREQRGRRRRAGKRRATVAHRVLSLVESEPEEFQPNDLQRQVAKRALRR